MKLILLLGFGAELKNTFCIKNGNKLILSQHIGNTYNIESYNMAKKNFLKFLEFCSLKPKFVLCDFNSEFNISKFAIDFSNEKRIKCDKVQHHIAHGFSVALEYNIDDFIAIVCDGFGYGTDGRAWGGEVFHNDKRIGRLEYHNLVGGDMASKEPVRFLVSILSKFLDEKRILEMLSRFDEKEVKTFFKMNSDNFNCIESSSCGRVLDAMVVLLGFADVNYYEGRCSIILESNCEIGEMFFEPKICVDCDGLFVLDTTCLFKFVCENISKIEKEKLAWFVHIYLAKGLHEIALKYDDSLPVVFSGGVAYNKFISGYFLSHGILLNKDIPSGDGGVSAGQIAYYLWKRGR